MIFSNAEQLTSLKDILSNYVRLPFSSATIPGAVLEGALAQVRQAKVLRTYDFVDVIKPDEHLGWQVKSTMATTPLTWMRAKIPNRMELIDESRKSVDGLQTLGNTLIDYCNKHALASLKLYDLDEIGYSRLLLSPNGTVRYFERLLCTKDNPRVFEPDDFEWRWSPPIKVPKKAQLPALHGYHRASGKKWFAWHGLGENQLHFSGEHNWWPNPEDPHVMVFSFPTDAEKLPLETLIKLLADLPRT